MLPTDANDFPICYTDEELQYLKGSDMIFFINLRKIQYENDYNYICEKVPDMKNFQYNDFIYCMSMVKSRAFAIKIGKNKIGVMIPFADMLNHTYPSQINYSFDEEINCFIMKPELNISFGDQVYNFYGGCSNVSLLLSYGFTLRDNEFVIKRIRLETLPADKDVHYELKKKLLGQ